ncbi:MAG: hypothetical protein O4860_06885, partial [Trichodesmium sp. St2_bin2_1]|nr:hypothetical protein [Trichodesmium sp. St2_bin2_1]
IFSRLYYKTFIHLRTPASYTNWKKNCYIFLPFKAPLQVLGNPNKPYLMFRVFKPIELYIAVRWGLRQIKK